MTLVILALATGAMARFASRSLSVVRQGAAAERALQDRWLLATCRLAILDRGEELLDRIEQEQATLGYGWPYPAELSMRLTLGGRDVELTLADEDAKLNLNWLHRTRPEQVSTILAQSAVYGGVPIRLQPTAAKPRERKDVFTSWGQVIDLVRVSQNQLLSTEISPITEAFSCWGRGKINIRRASDQTLRLALDGILTPHEVEQLLELRRGYLGEYGELLEPLELSRRKQILLRPLFATESSTFTMWMNESTGMVKRERLLVHDPTNRQTPETLVFEW